MILKFELPTKLDAMADTVKGAHTDPSGRQMGKLVTLCVPVRGSVKPVTSSIIFIVMFNMGYFGCATALKQRVPLSPI